jgi:hypothetical protein
MQTSHNSKHVPLSLHRRAGYVEEEIGFFPAEEYILYNDELHHYISKRSYKLNLLQRFFMILEEPQSCRLGKFVSIIVAVATMISCAIYILNSIPELKHKVDVCIDPVCHNDPEFCSDYMICEPESPALFARIEEFCLYIFCIDYMTRFILCSFIPPRLCGCWKNEGINYYYYYYLSLFIFNFIYSIYIYIYLIEDEDEYDLKEEIIKLLISGKVQPETSNFYKLYNKFFVDSPITSLRQQYMYITQIPNIIDFVAILPFFLSMAGISGSSVTIVRVLRLARILRILKMGKNSEGVKILILTMVNSLPALLILGFFSGIGLVLFGAIVFFFEAGEFEINDDYPMGQYMRINKYHDSTLEVSQFESIPLSMYWAVVTSTTVGYGDIKPTTFFGRFFAVMCMYCGIIVLALPISVIGNNFDRLYDAARGSASELISKSVIELLTAWPDYELIVARQDKVQSVINNVRKLSRDSIDVGTVCKGDISDTDKESLEKEGEEEYKFTEDEDNLSDDDDDDSSFDDEYEDESDDDMFADMENLFSEATPQSGPKRNDDISWALQKETDHLKRKTMSIVYEEATKLTAVLIIAKAMVSKNHQGTITKMLGLMGMDKILLAMGSNPDKLLFDNLKSDEYVSKIYDTVAAHHFVDSNKSEEDKSIDKVMKAADELNSVINKIRAQQLNVEAQNSAMEFEEAAKKEREDQDEALLISVSRRDSKSNNLSPGRSRTESKVMESSNRSRTNSKIVVSPSRSRTNSKNILTNAGRTRTTSYDMSSNLDHNIFSSRRSDSSNSPKHSPKSSDPSDDVL